MQLSGSAVDAVPNAAPAHVATDPAVDVPTHVMQILLWTQKIILFETKIVHEAKRKKSVVAHTGSPHVRPDQHELVIGTMVTVTTNGYGRKPYKKIAMATAYGVTGFSRTI